MAFENTKRINYQSKYLAVGPSPASGYHLEENGQGIPSLDDLTGAGSYTNLISQLHRIQSASFDWSVTREDVNQFARLARIGSEIVEAPSANLEFTYLLTNGVNEQRLGFNIDGGVSAISGVLNGTEDEKNYFILTSPQGVDVVGAADITSYPVIGIGNGFISNYSMEASVGSLAQATVSVEARQFAVDLTSSGNAIPAVNAEDGVAETGIQYVMPPAVTGEGNMPLALKHGDMTLAIQTPFGAKVTGSASANVQSATFDMSMARETLQRLGSKFDFSRELQFPLTASMSVNALVVSYEGGQLSDILCEDNEYDLTLTMREPSCVGAGEVAMIYTLKGAKIDSQSFSVDIQSNESVDLTFSTQIGGPEDTDVGVFISGGFVA
jgi:hypothetical protein